MLAVLGVAFSKFPRLVLRTVGMSLEVEVDAEPVFDSPLARIPTERERLAAVIAHAGTLFAWVFAPLAIFLIKRGESRWVEHHALQSLLWSLSGTLLSLLTCGLAIPVFLVWHVYAGIKVLQGTEYDYPIVGDFTRGLMSPPSSPSRA